jgi:hypothetical protein
MNVVVSIFAFICSQVIYLYVSVFWGGIIVIGYCGLVFVFSPCGLLNVLLCCLSFLFVSKSTFIFIWNSISMYPDELPLYNVYLL